MIATTAVAMARARWTSQFHFVTWEKAFSNMIQLPLPPPPTPFFEHTMYLPPNENCWDKSSLSLSPDPYFLIPEHRTIVVVVPSIIRCLSYMKCDQNSRECHQPQQLFSNPNIFVPLSYTISLHYFFTIIEKTIALTSLNPTAGTVVALIQ